MNPNGKETMPIASKYLLFVSMDVEADKLALFHEVYNEEHIPNLLTVPGVNSVARVEGEDFAVSIGGERKEIAHSGPTYTAIYELDDPSVLTSEVWETAVELSRRDTGVRPTPSAVTPCTKSADRFSNLS